MIYYGAHWTRTNPVAVFGYWGSDVYAGFPKYIDIYIQIQVYIFEH